MERTSTKPPPDDTGTYKKSNSKDAVILKGIAAFFYSTRLYKILFRLLNINGILQKTLCQISLKFFYIQAQDKLTVCYKRHDQLPEPVFYITSDIRYPMPRAPPPIFDSLG